MEREMTGDVGARLLDVIETSLRIVVEDPLQSFLWAYEVLVAELGHIPDIALLAELWIHHALYAGGCLSKEKFDTVWSERIGQLRKEGGDDMT